MGASVAAALLGERPGTAGLLLLHNTGGPGARGGRRGLPAQLHIAEPDVYQPAAEIAVCDPGTPGHDGPAAALAWQRSLSFLTGL